MQDDDRFYTLRFLCGSFAFGTVLGVLVLAAIILAASNIPTPNADSDSTTRIGQGILIVSASLLATAPLIQWWYNAIKWIFQIP